MRKFTESQLELAFIELLAKQDIPHTLGSDLPNRAPQEVLLKDDLHAFLRQRYQSEGLTPHEIGSISRRLEALPAADLYASNKAFMQWLADGFAFKRQDRQKKDSWLYLIDYDQPESNHFRLVTQLVIEGTEKRIPDAILYVNGLPLVVIEFKSAIRESATLHNAYEQLTVRYHRNIPELFKYNAFCMISDGANNKAGSFFAGYGFYYAWRRVEGLAQDVDGIDSLYTLVQGMFDRTRFCDIVRNFIFMPDRSNSDEKIVCRYPQYYAARRLYQHIGAQQRPQGSGKGGTYFGATGCGKSYTMLFLVRLLMKSPHFASPTIVLITDRTDLDTQLAEQFTNAKRFIGDQNVQSVTSREDLRLLLQGRQSGGVFLTTIQKFSEDTGLLTSRHNVICISDEAHRSQINLDQKVRTTEQGVVKSYGLAKHLHDSLPNATYVGFTGTPIDGTLAVFGEVVDAYTMAESVKDEITVRIVYEGRAAKVLLNHDKLREIEAYYAQCAQAGANAYQIEESKKATAQMNAIIGDPSRIKEVARDFVKHYERRLAEGASVRGKAMFVCSNRPIAFQFYQEVVALRPEWAVAKLGEAAEQLSESQKRKLKPIERIKLVMTRAKDDPNDMYELLGTKEHRKELDRQFKLEHSNFKIAIVVDMWLTGFDVPFLDTIYIDKPIQEHNLIQTISRVNRTFEQKSKGLVVDYIGIKTHMNRALKQFSKVEQHSVEELDQSEAVVKDCLDVLAQMFHKFDTRPYFTGQPQAQLECLNQAAEFVQLTHDLEQRFMRVVKQMKAAYDICCGSEGISQSQRDYLHFYLAVRSIVVKITKGDAPDAAQMNAQVRNMIKEALQSEGVEEILKMNHDEDKDNSRVDIFDEDYLHKIEKIKLPHTKIKLLQQLLEQSIASFKRVNKLKGLDFSKKMKALVDRYNERKGDVLQSEVLEDFTDEIIDLYQQMRKERDSFADMGIDFEEKAFYDILKALTIKYDFEYPHDKLLLLAQKVKLIVDDKAKYVDWNQRADIKAELKADLIVLLAQNGYPPIERDEVFQEIFEQAENFKKYEG